MYEGKSCNASDPKQNMSENKYKWQHDKKPMLYINVSGFDLYMNYKNKHRTKQTNIQDTSSVIAVPILPYPLTYIYT